MAADETKLGKPWADDELDAIVADYFAMLAAEQRGDTYVKAHHSAALMQQLGRTHRSVEFKHQNISAVLEALGLPWIPGYKPKRNYQQAIFGAIDRHLSANSALLQLVPTTTPVVKADAVFVEAPAPSPEPAPPPPELTRLIRKFDPVERDHRNRALGKAGEEFVLAVERERLAAAGRSDLSRKVRWVAAEDGDGAGFDILSFEATGQETLIEVKTTNGGARTPFFLTRTEREVSEERPDAWRLYRVHLFSRSPRIFALAPPLEASLRLRAEIWRASPQCGRSNGRTNPRRLRNLCHASGHLSALYNAWASPPSGHCLFPPRWVHGRRGLCKWARHGLACGTRLSNDWL